MDICMGKMPMQRGTGVPPVFGQASGLAPTLSPWERAAIKKEIVSPRSRSAERGMGGEGAVAPGAQVWETPTSFRTP